MKKIIFGLAVLTTVMACNQPDKTETTTPATTTDTDMKALYEKNLSTLKASISAFEKEDMNGWAAQVADSARWQSPAYGAAEGRKDDYKKALTAYTADWDSLQLVNASFLPGIDSTTQEFDGSVRYYGHWNGVHKSGVKTSVNYYGTFEFNKDNKIISGADFFDVGGLMNAVSRKK